MTTFQPANSNAVFLPTTIQYPKDPQELIIRLNKAYEDIATRLNVKQIGIFDLVEFLTGEQWFTTANPQVKRQTFRKAFEIGAIAAGATSTTAHGLTNVTAYTHIYGTAITDVIDYRPIPYASATVVTEQIEIKVDATNITIINGATAPNITSALVVLEYLKN
jgi:hypothetical protein